MPSYYRVESSMFKVRTVSELEPGMELARSAYNRDRRLIARKGLVLSEDLIDRFRRFNVSEVIIADTLEEWMSHEQAKNTGRKLNVIEKKDIDERTYGFLDSLRANRTISHLRKTVLATKQCADRAGDAGGTVLMDDLLNQLNALEDELDQLRERIEEIDDTTTREKLVRVLKGKLKQLQTLSEEINTSRSLFRRTVDAIENRIDIRTELSEYVIQNDELIADELDEGDDESSSAPDGFEDPVTSCVHGDVRQGVETLLSAFGDAVPDSDRRRLAQLRRDFSDQHERKINLKEALGQEDLSLRARRKLVQYLEGEKRFRFEELVDLSGNEGFARDIHEFVEEQERTRRNLWDVLSGLSDHPVVDGEKVESLEEDEFVRKSSRSHSEPKATHTVGGRNERFLFGLLNRFENHRFLEGVQVLDTFLDDASEDHGMMQELRERFVELVEKRDRIEERIDQELESGSETAGVLREVLDRKRLFHSQNFFYLDASQDLLGRVADYALQLERALKSIWTLMDDVFERDLRSQNARSDQWDRLSGKIARVRGSLLLDRSIEGEPKGASSKSTWRPEDHRHQTGLRSFRKRIPMKVSDEPHLDSSTVKVAQEMLVPPDSLSDRQRYYFSPFIDQVHSIFLGEGFNERLIRQTALELTDEIHRGTSPLSFTVEPPDNRRYLLVHGLNTCVVALSLAERFSLTPTEILNLTVAALTMDLGMVEVPPNFWKNDETLSPVERNAVENHPKYSKEIVRNVAKTNNVVEKLVHEHHERANGSGYPRGLESESQHALTPLLGLVDTYVAMLEDRPYRSARKPDEVMKILLRQREQFDVALLRALVETIGLYPDRSLVILEDGRLASVVEQSTDTPVHPRVKIMTDSRQKKLDSPCYCDLAEKETGVRKLVEW